MKKQLQEPASSVVSRLEPSEKDDLISRKALMQRLHDAGGCGAPPESWADGYDKAIDLAYGMAENAPAIDLVHAAGACYCRECKHWKEHYDYCIYYHPAHVLTDSGEEKGYEDMQPEAFDPLGTGLVTSEYGVNVGGQCERNRYDADDKTVFCGPDDFCSRGQRREEDCGDRVDKN